MAGLSDVLIYSTDGECLGKLSDVAEVDLHPIDNDFDVPTWNNSFTVDLKVNITRKLVLRICGITNNWLKFHGYPKMRKGIK